MLGRFGIAARTSALLTLVAATGLAAAAVWEAGEQRRTERGHVEARAAVLADAVVGALAEAMGEHRPETMRPILETVGRTEGVRGVSISGRRGTVRFGVGQSPPDGLGAPPSGATASWAAGLLILREPLANTGRCRDCHGPELATLGTVEVRFDGQAAEQRAGQAAGRMALLAFLALLLTAAVVGVVLHQAVARPLSSLRGFAEALGRGEHEARPPRAGGHEVGVLAEALRGMAEQVQRSHRELEDRVAERTAKLAEALAAAEGAREERTAALTRLQAIVDSMADGVIFVDAGAHIALVNEAGKVLRNLGGATGRDIKDCHPLASHAVLERVMGWLRQGDDAGPNHSIIKEKEGRYETTYAPVRAPDGGYLGVVMVIRDIAERRSLERRLLDAERLAGLGQMSAQVAHELRNPLNAISGAAEYLARRAPGPEVEEYTALIRDEVQRVSRFVDALLHVSRPANPVFSPTAVNRVLQEAARRVCLARGLTETGVRLQLDRGLPPLDLDQQMVMEAVVNLLDNAIDAGGAEPPELISRFEASGGEGSVVVEVADRGCGIPPDQLEEVTRPFVTTKARGTGLGLVVVQRAIEQHRAAFALRPREGGGTVAHLRFPVRTVRASEPLAEAG
ncbi:MAG: PAS domain-containing protein [Deltaproteobacteria bacterium]|nr:PAS domain-containing protein [Deltaproteobacteria bacterium]